MLNFIRNNSVKIFYFLCLTGFFAGSVAWLFLSLSSAEFFKLTMSGGVILIALIGVIRLSLRLLAKEEFESVRKLRTDLLSNLEFNELSRKKQMCFAWQQVAIYLAAFIFGWIGVLMILLFLQ